MSAFRGDRFQRGTVKGNLKVNITNTCIMGICNSAEYLENFIITDLFPMCFMS